MNRYGTGKVAKIIGVHPNTVRLYEEIGFITKPVREANGYRIFTDIHIAQMRFARTAMRGEVLQNGMRKKAVETVRLCAIPDIEAALKSAHEYINMIDEEIRRAEEAAAAVENMLEESDCGNDTLLIRKQAAQALGVTSDTLRNWELNGLIKAKRRSNGYRVYNSADMHRLKVIRTLRCADYSLSSILRLMNNLCNKSEDGRVPVKEILNTPSPDDEIISVCDRLLISLRSTRSDAESMISQLMDMRP